MEEGKFGGEALSREVNPVLLDDEGRVSVWAMGHVSE